MHGSQVRSLHRKTGLAEFSRGCALSRQSGARAAAPNPTSLAPGAGMTVVKHTSGLKIRPYPYPTLVLRGRNKCETHHLVLTIGIMRNANLYYKTCQQAYSGRWTLCTCATHDIYNSIVFSHVHYNSMLENTQLSKH